MISIKCFRQGLLQQAVPIVKNPEIKDIIKKRKLLDVIAEISKSMQISSPSDVEQALQLVNQIFSSLDEAQKPDTNLIRAAFTKWRNKPNDNLEDTSSERLNKQQTERFNDDVWETAYGSAMNAKIRAKQQANKVGINSLLFNEDGIIESSHDLNISAQLEQEKLLKNVIEYLKTRVSVEEQTPDVFERKLYENGEYTGIVERIASLYEKYLDRENFDIMSLNKDFNNKNYQRLDAYSSWVILNNFDDILQQTFGKALAINPDSSKYTADTNKYMIAGGSNVFNTWRTSEEIDLSKEINNITQAIITSLPLIHSGSTTPTDQNIKFNEFVYIIGKIKDLPYKAKNDYVFDSINPEMQSLSKPTIQYIEGKSFLNIINDIRSNPQQSLPVIFELLNNSDIIDTLQSNDVISNDTFLDVDLDIINSLDIGLFNGFNSLYNIQSKSGFKKVNYYSFITQTIDSIYRAGFLQYFRDPDGKIYIRNMFDQSVNNIQYGIQDSINSINSQMFIQNYDESKYNITETKQDIAESQNYHTIGYNGDEYDFQIYQGEAKVFLKKDNTRYTVDNQNLKNRVIQEYKSKYGLPENVNFVVKNFHKGPLTISVNIPTGIITYSVGGKEISGFNNEDYESLSEIIQDVLKQNFTIDQTYFTAFNKGQVGFATTQLMQMVSRVISNQYISNHYLKGLNPRDTKNKVNEIFGNSDAKPTFNRKLNEINLLTDKESGILSILAQAKALVTGRLTSSQILDGEGNALSSSSLSRFMSSIPYQVLQQVLQENSAAKDFTLWNQGVYLGIQQLKEIQDNTNDTYKPLTKFSPREMEESAIFVDFLQALLPEKSRTSSVNSGIAAFLPSENSDKTYIGRMMIDLKKVKIENQSLFDLLRTGKSLFSNQEFTYLVATELGNFYQKAFDNINEDWKKVGELIDQKVLEYNKQRIEEAAANQDQNFDITKDTIESSEFMPISYGKWEYINLVAKKLGISPLNLVNEVVSEYNNKDPQNPLVLTDQVHYISDSSGNLYVNQSLLGNLERFKDISKFQEFVVSQETDLLQTLLKDKVNIDTNEDFRTVLGENADRWIDSNTRKLILAYEIIDNGDGTESVYPIRRLRDVQFGFENDSVHGFELNPIISNYNILNYFFTQEFMNSTVGAFYAHPSKDKTGTLEGDEKSRKLAQDKRNVSFTAAMHSFQKNLLQGIPNEINIALMPDTIDQFETISGDVFKEITPLDGATFGNPFFTILENYSLGGAKVGINKKTFTHFYDQRTGTGGIIKTAEFPLTNNLIRNSKFYQVMMQNMTDRFWLNEDGSLAVVDITYDYDGNQMELANPNDINGQLFYQAEDGRYYAILSINPLGNNQYFRTLQEVDRNGNAIGNKFDDEPKVINTNYKLWKLFGGERAMELKIGDTSLTPTEHSIDVVVKIMNNTGTVKEGVDVVKFQSDIWQPLKHSDIHLMPTVGAVKQGAGNINSLDAYTTADASKINFMRIRMNQAGVQLDKEHHADGDELSIMTQVLSACAARGYTQQQSQDMYNAMAALARSGIKEYLDSFDEFFRSPNGESKDKYQKVILDTLLDAFAHNTNSSQMLQIVTQEILNKAKEGKDIAFSDLNKIPYSDPSVFRRLHSTISVALTRAAIKIKVDGILSVLQPSYNAIKLYGDRLLGSFTNDTEIQALQQARDLDPNFELRNNISQLRIGRTYKIVHPDGTIKLATIKTHNEYYRLKDQLRQFPDSIVSIREQFAPIEELGFEGGRELAAYNATFNSLDGRIFNIYDLASIKILARLKDIKASKEDINNALLNVQKDLNTLSKKSGILITDEGEIELDPTSVVIEPYEIVMPKVFKEIFGLDTYDDLNEIKNDPEFFTKRLVEKTKVQIPNSRYSLALLRLNGNHTYLLDSDYAVEVPEEFYRKTIYKSNIKGKLWRVDGQGNKLYQIGENDEVWVQKVNGKEVEIIVTNDIGRYVKEQKFNTLSISPREGYSNVMEILGKIRKDKKLVNQYLNALSKANSINENYLTTINDMSFQNLEGHPIEDYIRKQGARIHNSFLKSLGVVAARIPAQSMQSFMPMKVVAFDAPDINTAYVNTAHFLFQGSDLDIDAVSLAAYAFDHSGNYILHSPFADIETKECLEASERLPFPTGKTLEINKKETINYEDYVGRGDLSKPILISNNSIRINTSSPETIEKLGELIRLCNERGYVPAPDSNNETEIKNSVLFILQKINEHNHYINDSSVEQFSKNFIVSSMYNIGINPANLIESQQAMDTITKPLKDVANSTIKAQEDTSKGNVGSYATNIHGIAQNMAGKEGVGICAVGLKTYFALTARYNEVLNNGTPEEVERLKSKIEIAGQNFRMLANAYTTNEVNAAILGEVLTQLDQSQDQALILSALLSLATDNAKELALDKLNASNFLGMYIYGTTIGMNFQTLSNIISSKTGIVLNELMSSNAFSGEQGLSMQNIFDYIELGPVLPVSEKLSNEGSIVYNKYLQQEKLWELAYSEGNIEEKIQFLEDLKVNGDTVLNNLIEKAQEYVEQVDIINNDSIIVKDNNSTSLRHNRQIYEDIKKLNEGGEELRKQGQLLHINQGLETQYLKAINYIETLTSIVSDRKYSNYKELKRKFEINKRKGLIEPNAKGPQFPSSKWKFDFHNFVSNESYRNAWIDIYGGIINSNLFLNEEVYRKEILEVTNLSKDNSDLDTLLKKARQSIKSAKVFFNILDTMQVPHFFSYLQASDMLHQAMMKTSAKYRAIYTLGKDSINLLGAYSMEDKENIFKRTEQFVDRVIRDRFLVQTKQEIRIPKGQQYFVEEDRKIIKKTASTSDVIIQLGTRAGNASFKALMETKIIPDLQQGKIGGNIRDSFIQHNLFIKSLSQVIYRQNPEYSVTVNTAPNINMSPRSDTDKALFEQIKYDFNQLRMSQTRYQIGPNKYDLIELFWYYNQIAFHGRPGENTLTSIFQDVLDYKIIKQFRDFINDFDNNHDLGESIMAKDILMEVAPKANVWTTKLKHFYYEDLATGKLAYWSKALKIQDQYGEFEDYSFGQIRGYQPSVLSYLNDGDLKNFVTSTKAADVSTQPLDIPLKDGIARLEIAYGGVQEIKYYSLDDNGNPDFSQEKVIEISIDKKQFFSKIPTKVVITANGIDIVYDIDRLSMLVDNLINCG